MSGTVPNDIHLSIYICTYMFTYIHIEIDVETFEYPLWMTAVFIFTWIA